MSQQSPSAPANSTPLSRKRKRSDEENAEDLERQKKHFRAEKKDFEKFKEKELAEIAEKRRMLDICEKALKDVQVTLKNCLEGISPVLPDGINVEGKSLYRAVGQE